MLATRTAIQLALAMSCAPLPAADAPQDAAIRTLAYACDENKRITATVDDDAAAISVSVDGDAAMQNLQMRYVMSANGEKASNGKLVWWTRGNEGFLAEEDPPAGSGEVLIGGCVESPAVD